MKIYLAMLLFLLLLPTACHLSLPRPRDIPTGFLNQTMTVDNQTRRYVLYVPAAYNPARSWPLVVFLHGMGERGEDGLVQTEVGIGRALRRHPDRFPCLVLMPQCPGKSKWTNALAHARAALAKTISQYNVNQKEITLTGLSMGGFGTWAWAAEQPELFTRIMPLCGGGDPNWAKRLTGIPIHVCHGINDPVIPPERSREMVTAIRKEGGSIIYTEYANTTHNCWDKAYSDPQVVKWLLVGRVKNN